ncbi:MAG: hypothetical protein ACFBZ8_07005 [Opitutales bacterium]
MIAYADQAAALLEAAPYVLARTADNAPPPRARTFATSPLQPRPSPPTAPTQMHTDDAPYAFFLANYPAELEPVAVPPLAAAAPASVLLQSSTTLIGDWPFQASDKVGYLPMQRRPDFATQAHLTYRHVMDLDSIDQGGNDSIVDIGDRAELMNSLHSFYHANASNSLTEWTAYVLTNAVLVQTLKAVLQVPRIDGGSTDSMPSGHADAASLGAFYIAESYGYSYASEPLQVALVTGFSRTLVRKANPEEWWLSNDFNRRDPAHRPGEVFAGLGIAFITSKLMVREKVVPKDLDYDVVANGLRIVPVPYGDSVGLMITMPAFKDVALMPYLGSNDGGIVLNIPWGVAAANPILRN